MRMPIAGVAVGVVLAGAANAAGAEKTDNIWSFVFSQDIRYISWSGTRGYPADLAPPGGTVPKGPGHGTQVYVPVSLQVTGKPANDVKLEILTRSGYVSSRQTTAGLAGSASTATDTSVTTTATYYGFNGFQPFVALALNLPTGTASLYGVNGFARMDPDIVSVPTFGEGFNVGPSAGVNVPIDENTLFTLTAGYTVRGAFNREGNVGIVPQRTTHVNPSDIFTITPAFAKVIDKLSFLTSFSYSTETENRSNGLATFQSGDRYNLFGWVSYAYSSMVNPSISMSFTHTKPQRVVAAVGAPILPEPLNSNSDVVQVNLDNTSTIGKFSFGPTVGYLHRDHNGYSSDDFSFVPAKTKWSAGGFMNYQVNDRAKLRANVQHIWISEDLQADKAFSGAVFLGGVFAGTGVPALTDNAWVTSFGGTITF